MTTGWVTEAACREVGTEMFFPDEGGSPQSGGATYRQAAQVCAHCPVWRECRLMGLAEGYGLWGGLSPLKRQAIRQPAMKELMHRGGGAQADGELAALRRKITAVWRRVGTIDRVLDEIPTLNHPLMHVFTLTDNQGSARKRSRESHDAA